MKIEIENLKDLGKDIRSFPRLVALIVLLTLAAALLGYVIFLKGDGRFDTSKKPEMQQSVQQPEEEKSDTAIVGEDIGNVGTAYKDDRIDRVAEANAGQIKISSSEDLQSFEIWNATKKVGEIKTESPSSVKVVKTIGSSAYLSADFEGVGGYILFGGPYALYRLDMGTNLLEKLYDGRESSGFFSDISADGKRLLAVSHSYKGDVVTPYIEVWDVASRSKAASYQVAAKYHTAGEAYFAKSGGRIVYEAALNDPSAEEFAMFTVDLATGKQSQIGGDDSYGKAGEWAKNN